MADRCHTPRLQGLVFGLGRNYSSGLTGELRQKAEKSQNSCFEQKSRFLDDFGQEMLLIYSNTGKTG